VIQHLTETSMELRTSLAKKKTPPTEMDLKFKTVVQKLRDTLSDADSDSSDESKDSLDIQA